MLNEVLMTLDLADGQTTLTGVQLMPIGKWRHPRGTINITPERARKFAEGFQKRLAGQDLPILYIHSDQKNVSNPNYGRAAGWIRGVKADDTQGVMLDIEFTEHGAQAVRNKEYRYLSAEYFDKVQLPHHERPYEDVIVGAALVNRPHLKGMNPILNEETGHQFLTEVSDNNGGGPMDPILVQLAELAGQTISDDATELTEDQGSAIVEWARGLQQSTSDTAAKLKLAEQRIAQLEDPEETKAKSLREAGFEEEATLLSEYRAERLERQFSEGVPAGSVLTKAAKELIHKHATEGDQQALNDAFKLAIEGKAVVSLTEKGTEGADPDAEETNLGEELVSLATKRAKEDDIPFSEAMSLVADENPEKWNTYQGELGSTGAKVGG